MNDIDTLIEKAMADATLFDTIIPPDVMAGLLTEDPDMPPDEYRRIALRSMFEDVPEAKSLATIW